MDAIAKKLEGVVLTFPAKASETGKLYGSITTQMVSEAIQKKTSVEVARRQIDMQPLRSLGTFKISIRLTVDLIPSLTVIIHREGEAPAAQEPQEAVAGEEEAVAE